ncbi:MAG: hypothetical protein HXX13_09650 [Bacteroidetes bacterium]|nr:hypothetical protein [Bacteroidota bacterium]
MKKISFAILILFTAIIGYAQDNQSNTNEPIKTLFGRNKDAKLGWFVEFDNGYTQFDKRDVNMSGFNFGLIVNHNLSLGFSGSGWTNRNDMYYNNVADSTGAYLEGGMGRFMLEYTLNPSAPVHLTFPMMIGVGGASYVTDKEYYDWKDKDWNTHHKTIDTDAFFSFEPGVRAEVNVFKFMRLNAGVSYRYVSGLELVHTSDNLMNNFSATVGLKFGKF